MTENPSVPPERRPRTASAPATREERLKAALKANMARRKAQARARSGGHGAEDDGSAPDEA